MWWTIEEDDMDFKELEEKLQEFFTEDGIDGLVCDWVILVDYIPNKDVDASGFAVYYRDGDLRWKSAYGLLKLWEMKLNSEYRHLSERGDDDARG